MQEDGKWFRSDAGSKLRDIGVSNFNFAGALPANIAMAGMSGTGRGGENSNRTERENMDEKILATNDETAVMVVRLKESKERAEIDDRMRGMKSGWIWAARRATYRQLRIIEKMAEEFGDPEFLDDADPAGSVARTLATNLDLFYGEQDAEEELLDTMFPLEGTRGSVVFVAAFVKAAAETWKEVEEQVG